MMVPYHSAVELVAHSTGLATSSHPTSKEAIGGDSKANEISSAVYRHDSSKSGKMPAAHVFSAG